MTDWEIAEFLAKELMGWNQYPWVIKGWSPCTRIDQALGDGGPGTVVGEILELGYDFDLRSQQTGSFYATFGVGVEGLSPARAICLAAVKVLKGEE